MPEVIIDYQKIVNYVGKEIQHIWQELVSEGSDEIKTLISAIKSIEVSDEQYFRKQESNRKLRRGTVYLIVRFSSGAINYASSVTPISIYGLGVANQVKPVQLLLGTFASYWTTKNMLQGLTEKNSQGQTVSIEVSDMLQVWNTPEVVSNFNIVDDDFRNLYRVTGNIVIGPAAIRVGTLTYYYNNQNDQETSETINIMAFQDNFHSSLDSQPFGNTNGFVQSEVNFSTYTFSISTYLLNSQLARDILAMRGFRYRPGGVYTISGIDAYDEQGNPKFSLADANKKMKLKIDFTNDFNNAPETNSSGVIVEQKDTSEDGDPVKGDDFYMYYKVVDSGIKQEIGGIPALTISFTR